MAVQLDDYVIKEDEHKPTDDDVTAF
jgi:hypothetical protein